jgi:uncharacterized damage-inducible protein DinB
LLLNHLFEHNAWANDRLLEFCEGLDRHQLAGTAVGTYGRLDDTLVHVLAAESRYIWRLTGEELQSRLKEGERPPVKEMRRHAAEVGHRWQELLAAADEPWLNGSFETEFRGEKTQLYRSVVLAQMLHHGNDHRAHCCVVITQLGLEPPDLSGWRHGEAKFG